MSLFNLMGANVKVLLFVQVFIEILLFIPQIQIKQHTSEELKHRGTVAHAAGQAL